MTHPDARPADTAAELWRRIVAEAGIEPGGRDRGLVEEIRQRLALGPGTLADELTGIATERLVEALFAAIEPFARMWSDLLVLYERASATAGGRQLDVAFDFSAGVTAAFDLEHFRRVIQQWRLVKRRFDLRSVGPREFWNVAEAWAAGQRSSGDARFTRPDELAAFVHAANEGRFPGALPDRPPSGAAGIDALAEETWALAAVLLDDVRPLESHAALMAAHGEQRDTPSGTPFDVVRLVESDYWLAYVLTAVWESVVTGSADETAIERALQPLRNNDATRTAREAFLLDVLSLPIWKHRYDLYSCWVAAVLVTAFDDQDVIVHAADGVLRFSFTGTHLATLGRLRPRLHLWTEFRAALDDPVGEGRVSAIQPDITFLADPLTTPRSPLVVECKQYAKAANRAFAEALTDYARGHPAAKVVLVNYGPARAAGVLGLVTPDVVDRTHVIASLRPDEPAAVADFRAYVRAAVGLDRAEPAAAPRRGDPARAGRIQLTWGAIPKDLDLRLASHDGSVEVSYRSKGASDGPPYARLLEDVVDGYGPEVIEITRLEDRRYDVVVEQFSDDGDLAGSGAEVVVTLGGDSYTYRCPDDHVGRTWRVCRIDGSTGAVE